MARIAIECLPEPVIEFGKTVVGVEPRRGLTAGGPVDGRPGREIRLGFVGTEEDVRHARRWVARFDSFMAAHEGNSARYRDWPGSERALGCRFVSDERFVRSVDADKIKAEVERRGSFDELLNAFASRIEGLFIDGGPDAIVVCLPDELADLRIANPALTPAERNALERLQAEEENAQLTLFQPTPEELRAAEDLRTQAEDLLFRTYYRALKARLMMHRNAIPIQILRRDTIDRPDDEGQSHATRAWNVAASLYYKSGGIPWRPGTLSSNVCYVGVSFHHLKRRAGSLVYASVAQAFSTDVEPFALKGAMVDHQQRRDRHPYLNPEQARDLISQVLDQYEARAGVLPDRLVVHKTSAYQPEEEAGFRQGAHGRVPVCDLVWLRSTAFRIVRRGMQEPWRGTLCTLGEQVYLFTSGFIPWWNEYPGPHIPAPIEIGAAGSTDLRERAREILALSKMNWNSTDGWSRFPITISFAKRVGQLMSELSDGEDPNPSYRFYM